MVPATLELCEERCPSQSERHEEELENQARLQNEKCESGQVTFYLWAETRSTRSLTLSEHSSALETNGERNI